MGMMDKFLNVLRLNTDEDEEEYYDDEFFDDGDEDDFFPSLKDKKPSVRREKPQRQEKVVEEEAPAPSRFTAQKEPQVKPQPKPAASKVTPMRQSKRAQGGNAAMEVCVLKPSSFEDAREITDTILNNRTVILNLEGFDPEIGQKIIDFTAGSCYALDGNLQKISNYIFIVTPSCVDISGDFQNFMEAFDTSSMSIDI